TYNSNKKSLFSAAERQDMLKELCKPWPNVAVDTWEGLVAEYALQGRAGESKLVLIRGIRDSAEWQAEYTMSLYNKSLGNGLETIFLSALPEYAMISSTGVREVAEFGGDLSKFVPGLIQEKLTANHANDYKNKSY
ncbi:MAG: hypothetical protein LBM77_10300, partial [Spirochaetaceae bacterium]|nr:hypothetical protein [Spirochaetaceae bacterium]